MDEDIKEMTSKDILNYWEKLEIYNDDSKKALFLLGYLIGKIGNVQKNKEIKNKPILNKINFQGMGTEKLIRLSNDIFEKLIQYKTKKGEILLNFSENNNSYSIFKMWFEKKMIGNNLSNQENVFYVLSGYAFENYLIRKKSKEKYFEELKITSEYVGRLKDEVDNKEIEIILEKAKKLADEHKYSEARNILKPILNKIKEDNNEVDKDD